MNIDNSIGKALFFSGDAGSAKAAAGLQGMADGGLQSASDGMTARYAGSLFQQMIVQMLAAKGSAAGAEDQTIGGGAQVMAGETDGGLLAGILTDGNLSGISLLYDGTVANEAGGLMLAGDLNPAAGSPEVFAALNGGQLDEMQAFMMAMTGSAPVLDNSWTAFGSQAKPGAEVMAVSAGASAAGSDDTGIPASLKALFMGGAQAAVLVETGSLQEGADAQPTAKQQAQQAAIAGSNFQAFGAYGSDGKALASGTGQAALNSGNSAAPVLTEMDPAGTASPSQTEMNANNRTAIPGQEAVSGSQSTVTGSTSLEAGAVKIDKASEEAAADTSRIPQEAQHLPGTGQTGGAAEQIPSIPTAEKAEPYSQIRDEILAKLEQKGPAEFKMQLEPADLGQIDIKMKLSEGKLIIDILAASSRTQALLTSQVDKLIACMGLQNVQVESIQVGQQMNSQNQDGSQGQGYQTNAGMDFSQRRQQEQLQDELLKSGSLTGASGLQQNEAQESNPAGSIDAFRYGSYQMNYTV